MKNSVASSDVRLMCTYSQSFRVLGADFNGALGKKDFSPHEFTCSVAARAAQRATHKVLSNTFVT